MKMGFVGTFKEEAIKEKFREILDAAIMEAYREGFQSGQKSNRPDDENVAAGRRFTVHTNKGPLVFELVEMPKHATIKQQYIMEALNDFRRTLDKLWILSA